MNRNKISPKVVIISILTICAIIAIIFYYVNENRKNKIIKELTTYAGDQFKSEFDSYISKLNTTDLSISGAYKFKGLSYNSKDNLLDITCYVTYKSDNISNYYTKKYDSETAKTLCRLLKTINQVIKDNKYYSYTCKNVGNISITIESNNSYYGITVYGTDKNKYAYEYAVDYDEVLINDDYVYMESDGSYTPSSSSSNTSKGTTITDDELGTCWALAEDIVKSHLKSPSSAKFPFSYADEDVSITKSGDIYTVKSWVDSENSLGATLRSNFTVTITKSGSKFTAESCIIDE